MGGAEPRTKKRRARRRTPRKPRASWRGLARSGVEAAALLGAALIGVIAGLGHAADRFTGPTLWSHLLPFAGAVLALAVAVGAALRAWLALRRWLASRFAPAPLIVALLIAAGAGWLATQPQFRVEVSHLHALVGGSAEAERRAIAHQVFAAYRRADHAQLQRMFERARAYEAVAGEAAAASAVDPEVLMGIAATESSFEPRDSADGGRGLFQITSPPAAAVSTTHARLGIDRLDLHDPRHNAFLAAATLRSYLDQMRGDLFLGLLAYNIGPHNGGLHAIMQQYGARDFVTIQPYLQHLPRDYPIRVLSAALAYRLWRINGHLPPYEEGDNATRIQHIGIPGLMAESDASMSNR